MSGTAVVLIEPEMPVKADYVAYKNQDFTMEFVWKDANDVAVDLSAATATYKVAAEHVRTFLTDYSTDTPFISITQASGITMNVDGEISVVVDDTVFDSVDPGIYIHTLTVTRSGTPTHIVVGEWRLKPAL